MPPVAAPDVYNATILGYDDTYDPTYFYDYVQTGHSISYKEMAVFRFAEEPTVGSMPMYQWAYVDPEGLQAHWADLYDRAEAELEEVIRAAAYEEIKAEITTEVNNDETIMGFNKPGVIKERLDAADDEGGLVDQRTAAYMADSAKKDAFLLAHYEDLLRLYVCDYDEAINYKVYETDGEGNVVLDDEKNPVETDEFLLTDNSGELLDAIENSEIVWVSRLIDRFIELNKYVLVDAEQKDEVQINPDLVDKDTLQQWHDQGGKIAISNKGTAVINGKTYTKYQQNGSSQVYYLDEAGNFFTMKETNIPAVTQTVSKLSTLGLILIIAGAVVAVAGVAFAVLIVLKKKNKPVAADDVAAEGEIQIIDETVEEAPAENNEQ
jgi:hypothetical protein